MPKRSLVHRYVQILLPVLNRDTTVLWSVGVLVYHMSSKVVEYTVRLTLQGCCYSNSVAYIKEQEGFKKVELIREHVTIQIARNGGRLET
jgi:hypothetical protein